MKKTTITVTLLAGLVFSTGCSNQSGQNAPLQPNQPNAVDQQQPAKVQPVSETTKSESLASDESPAGSAGKATQPLDAATVSLVAFVVDHQPLTKAQMQIWLQNHNFAVLTCEDASYAPGEMEECRSGGIILRIDQDTTMMAAVEITSESDSFKKWYSILSPILKNAAVVEHKDHPLNAFDPSGQSRLPVETYAWTSNRETKCAFPSNSHCKRWLLQLIESFDPRDAKTTLHFSDMVEAQASMRRNYEKMMNQ